MFMIELTLSRFPPMSQKSPIHTDTDFLLPPSNSSSEPRVYRGSVNFDIPFSVPRLLVSPVAQMCLFILAGSPTQDFRLHYPS